MLGCTRKDLAVDDHLRPAKEGLACEIRRRLTGQYIMHILALGLVLVT